MMLLQPQEVEVFYILPAIRRELALELKRLGRSQRAVADVLGVTGAAVSQYLSGKRAQTEFPVALRKEIAASAPRITDRESMVREMQRILVSAREDRMICRLHEKLSGDIPRGCDICFTKRKVTP